MKDLHSTGGFINVNAIGPEGKFVTVSKIVTYENDKEIDVDYQIKQGINFHTDQLDVEKFDFEEAEKAFLRMYDYFEKAFENELGQLCKEYRYKMQNELGQKYNLHAMRTKYTMITKKCFDGTLSPRLNKNPLIQETSEDVSKT